MHALLDGFPCQRRVDSEHAWYFFRPFLSQAPFSSRATVRRQVDDAVQNSAGVKSQLTPLLAPFPLCQNRVLAHRCRSL